MKLISVVVPVYNIEKYVGKCIESILCQTYTNIEVIIVNDGSTDNSLSVCHMYQKKDKRIKIINKDNGGLSEARNYGLHTAKGEYICFIDGDDYIHSKMLENMLNACDEYDVDISICAREYCFDDNEIDVFQNKKDYNSIVMSGKEAFRHFLLEDIDGFVVAWNKLYKKKLFTNNSIEYPVGKIHEDCFTTYKLFLASSKVAYVDYVGYCYRQRNNSIMHSKNSIREVSIVEAYEEILKFTREYVQEYVKEAEYRYVIANLYLASVADNKKIISECKRNVLKIDYTQNKFLKGQRLVRAQLLVVLGEKYAYLSTAFLKFRTIVGRKKNAYNKEICKKNNY